MNAQPAQQIPGIYHRKIGDIIVTAVSDGYLDGTLEVMRNVDVEKARQILTRLVPAGTANQRQHLPDPFEGTHRDRRHRIGQLFAAHSRLRSAQPRIGRYRSEVDRYGLADPHASGSFRRPDRHVERAASVSKRGTCDARERTGALVRRRRDGEGRRAIGTTLFSGRPRTGRALQKQDAIVQGRRGVSRRNRRTEPRAYAGPHRVSDRVRQRSIDDLGRHGARAGSADRVSRSRHGLRH